MQNVSENKNIAPAREQSSKAGATASEKAFEIALQSSELAVRDALGQLTSKLETYACDPAETATVELVVAEILNNIVEHAFAEEEPEGIIRMNCAMADDGLHMQIWREKNCKLVTSYGASIKAIMSLSKFLKQSSRAWNGSLNFLELQQRRHVPLKEQASKSNDRSDWKIRSQT